MDMVSMVAAISTSLAQAQTQDAIGNAVLKQAMNQQGAAVMPLIEAATGISVATSTANSPPNLGQNVDTFV